MGMPSPHTLPPEARLKLAEPLTLCVLAAALGVIALVALNVSMVVAGTMYAIGFVLLSFVRTDLALLVIIATTPFLWDIGGGPVKMAVSEVSLILALPALVLRFFGRRGRFAFNPMWVPISCYLIVCCVSTLLSGNVASSVTSMLQMVIYLVVTVFVFSCCVERPSQVIPGFFALLLIDCVLALLLVTTRQQYLLGLHKNAVGAILGYGTVIAAELWFASGGRQRRLLGLIFAVLGFGLVFTLSRGAWVGAAGGTLVILGLRGQFKLALRLLIVLIPLVSAAWLLVPEEQREYATSVTSESGNIRARFEMIDYAMTHFKSSPLLGVGVGLRKQYDATNLVMSVLAETGVFGLATFLGIIATFAWMIWSARRRIGVTDDFFPALAIGAALMTNKFLHGLVDHYWGRGLLPVWGAAGMAAFAYTAVAARSARRPGDVAVRHGARVAPVVVRPGGGLSR